MGASLCSLHVPGGYVGRAGFGMNRSHVFAQGELAALVLGRGWTRNGVARVRASCELRLPLCSVAFPSILKAGEGRKLLEQKPGGSGPSCLSSLQVCALRPPSTSTLAPEGSCTGTRGAGAVTRRVRARAVAIQLESDIWTAF